MTLDTRFVINAPTDPREVFDFCNSLIGATEATQWSHDEAGKWKWQHNHAYRNHAGQGLCALMDVEYGVNGGKLREDKYDDEGIEITGVGEHEPEGYVEVSFDTAYGYRGPGGLTCGELHAGLVAHLGRWCEERAYPHSWQNEFSGEWFQDWRVAADELGKSSEAARKWFMGTVLPAIEAEHGPVTL